MPIKWLRSRTQVPSSGDADVGLAQGGRLRIRVPGDLVFAGVMNETRAGDYAIVEFYAPTEDTESGTVPLAEGILEHNRAMNVRWQGRIPVENGMYVQPRIVAGTANDFIVTVAGVEVP